MPTGGNIEYSGDEGEGSTNADGLWQLVAAAAS